MDGSRPGEAGVIAWCNSIRFAMAKDPGRQFLYEQIQTEGFDFLDMYLEKFLEGPRKEPVIELLKTPGRKKTAAKVQAVTSISFEDGATKENLGSMNDFQRALLQAKEEGDASKEKRSTRPRSPEQPSSHSSGTFGKQLKNQRIVTIADSPAVHVSESAMEVDEVRVPLPALAFSFTLPISQPTVHETSLQPPVDAAKELSMIAEDDEITERSRASLGKPPLDEPQTVEMVPQSPMHTETQVSADLHVQDDDADSIAEADFEDPVQDDITTTSVTTFHTIPLGLSQQSDTDSHSARTAEFHTAPLPRVSLPPVPVEEEPHSHTAPLPSSSRHKEYTMPLREEPSAPVPGLSRKPSVSHFTGLPAPSPLRKSLRAPGDTGPPTGSSVPPSMVKRTSTSWLSKARETKALETTSKRASTLGLGVNTFTANKRKSSDMLEAANAVLRSLEDEERAAKVPRLANSPATDPFLGNKGNGTASSPDTSSDTAALRLQPAIATEVLDVAATVPAPPANAAGHDDMLTTILKNHGSRVAKSTSKSLGGNAAAALAEARAAAEARVAERHKLEMGDVSMGSEENPSAVDAQPAPVQSAESERRLSVSDLIPSSKGKSKEKLQESVAQVMQPTPPGANVSNSTTPPNSPPRSRNTSFVAPTGPVFSKPAPSTTRTEVPAPSANRDYKLPTENPFSIPAAMTLGMGIKFQPLSAQSSKASVFSDVVFDRPDASPAWMPSTQDTSYSAAQSQSQPKGDVDDEDALDADDSWGVDDKFGGHQMWTPFGFQSANPDQLKDDTMTWSTIPSRSTSQKGGDTQPTRGLFPTMEEEEEEEREVLEPERGFAERLAAADQHTSDVEDDANDEADVAMEIDQEDVEDKVEEDDIEGAILAGKSTVKLVQKPDLSSQTRSDSQQSMASTTSSQSNSNLGILGQASKLVSSVFGGGKKAKPEVKSLQLAAAAAKKQQEEQEKKAQRLKEMEARRQQALQRKMDEEKARQLEEERKIKGEVERRKREREEHTDKRPLSRTANAPKKNEDDTSKRKLGAATSQKPPSKDKKDTAPPKTVKPSMSASSKLVLKSALKQPTAGSSVPATPGTSKAPAPKTVKHAPSSSNIKIPPPAGSKGKEKDIGEPLQSRPKTPAGPPPAQEPPRVASESIELPDINSEYSDSEDEDRPKRDLPDWAKSPDIAAALQQQSTINPDDIFGPIGPLRMEEIFRTRHSRFRARSSSANWTGTDELTRAEEREYARRMGFK
ncbi:hypothetical protein LXA43DRAFT_982300 [Ganoderma leucocontextum]|nr:hypothetical protein LXA43DRAFT_982300 [Ganoderma leucocontextum]